MKLLTVQQAAEYLGVSPNTLRIWDAKGIFCSLRTPGNKKQRTVRELAGLYGIHPTQIMKWKKTLANLRLNGIG